MDCQTQLNTSQSAVDGGQMAQGSPGKIKYTNVLNSLCFAFLSLKTRGFSWAAVLCKATLTKIRQWWTVVKEHNMKGEKK